MNIRAVFTTPSADLKIIQTILGVVSIAILRGTGFYSHGLDLGFLACVNEDMFYLALVTTTSSLIISPALFISFLIPAARAQKPYVELIFLVICVLLHAGVAGCFFDYPNCKYVASDNKIFGRTITIGVFAAVSGVAYLIDVGFNVFEIWKERQG